MAETRYPTTGLLRAADAALTAEVRGPGMFPVTLATGLTPGAVHEVRMLAPGRAARGARAVHAVVVYAVRGGYTDPQPYYTRVLAADWDLWPHRAPVGAGGA